MPKNRLFVAVLILVFLFSTVGVVNLSGAEVTIFPWDMVFKALPIISVNSPLNNSTLYVDFVPLNITITKPKDWLTYGGYDVKQMLIAVGYILDGRSYGPFAANNDLASPFNYYVNLTLNQGSHTLQVYGNASGYIFSPISGTTEYVPITGWSDIVNFTTLPVTPTVEVQPLEINGTALTLSFTVDEPVSKLTYSLDDQDNVSIAGNTTITNLPYGHHELIVYATNPVGNIGASQTISFEVPEPFPTMSVVVISVVAVVAVVGVGLLVYFMKRKH
jgi:hypothetical protein